MIFLRIPSQITQINSVKLLLTVANHITGNIGCRDAVWSHSSTFYTTLED